MPLLPLFLLTGRATTVVASAVLVCGALGLAAPVAAQSGLKLGEPQTPDTPATLDLGARAPATGTAAPTGPTQPPAARPVGQAPDVPVDPPSASVLPEPAAGEGEPVSRKTYGDWEVACAANGQCAMAQIGEDEDGVPVLEMVIRKLPEPLEVGDRTAIAVLDVVTPLGVVLTEGLGLTIDGGRTEAAPFQICTEQGCLVREPIDAGLIGRLKGGRAAKVGVTAANKGPISSSLSLSGFTAAYGAMN